MNYDLFPRLLFVFYQFYFWIPLSSPSLCPFSVDIQFVFSHFCSYFFSFIFLWIQYNSIFFYFPHENWLWINTAYFGGFMYLLLVCKVYFKDFLENNFELKVRRKFFSLSKFMVIYQWANIFKSFNNLLQSEK